MSSSFALLAPVFALLAFMLQGCIFSDYKPAVRIAIGHACDDRADDFSDKVGLKEIEGAKACDDLDADKLKEFNVTDCDATLHSLAHFFFTVECEATVSGNITSKCKTEDFKGAECKTALDEAVKSFAPFEEGESSDTEESTGFEATLGLVTACATKVGEVVNSPEVTGSMFENECKKTDDDAMTAMGVTKDNCKTYLKKQIHQVMAVACIITAFTRDDLPEKPDDVTQEWLTTAATDFADGLKEHWKSGDDAADLKVFDGYHVDSTRLFQMLRKGQWPGKLRALPYNITMICGASLIVSVALAAIAWRRFGTQQGSPQNGEPILGGDVEGNAE